MHLIIQGADVETTALKEIAKLSGAKGIEQTAPDVFRLLDAVPAEGIATLTPVATGPNDAVVDEHISFYRATQGEHPDWNRFRQFVVANRQLVLTLTVERVYGVPQE